MDHKIKHSVLVVDDEELVAKIMEIESSDPDDRDGRQMIIQNI